MNRKLPARNVVDVKSWQSSFTLHWCFVWQYTSAKRNWCVWSERRPPTNHETHWLKFQTLFLLECVGSPTASEEYQVANTKVRMCFSGEVTAAEIFLSVLVLEGIASSFVEIRKLPNKMCRGLSRQVTLLQAARAYNAGRSRLKGRLEP